MLSEMPSSIHCRLVGYGVTLVVHAYTFHDVLSRLAVTTADPIVADFATLQDKFITIWTFLFQMAYVTLGITCDLLNLSAGEDKAVSKTMNWLRETLFSAIVWPTSLLIPALFWPLYLYNERLVFPPYIGKVLSEANNHVMHSMVVLVVVWELVFLRRGGHRNHKLNLAVLVGYLILYLITLLRSFLERGSFIYPILNQLYGTLYLYLIFVVTFVLAIFFYSVQWPLTSFAWGTDSEKRYGKKNQ